MNKFKLWSSERPLIFGLIVVCGLILMVFISSAVVSAIWPGETVGWFTTNSIGRLISILILLLALWRLGWLRSAGFTRPGRWDTWLVLSLPLAYSIAISAYAMTRNFDFRYSDPALAVTAALFIMLHASLEEVTFRGLILHNFVIKYGNIKNGLMKSVLFSSLFFGLYHFIYLAGEPLQVVLLRMVTTFFLGIYFGTLVIRAASIYPAVFFHGIINLAAYLNLTSNGIEATASAWLLMSLLIIPLAVYSIFLLRRVTSRKVVPTFTGD